jgi:hypothetical protein
LLSSETPLDDFAHHGRHCILTTQASQFVQRLNVPAKSITIIWGNAEKDVDFRN